MQTRVEILREQQAEEIRQRVLKWRAYKEPAPPEPESGWYVLAVLFLIIMGTIGAASYYALSGMPL